MQIADSLKRFGVSDGISAVLVARFNATADEVRQSFRLCADHWHDVSDDVTVQLLSSSRFQTQAAVRTPCRGC